MNKLLSGIAGAAMALSVPSHAQAPEKQKTEAVPGPDVTDINLSRHVFISAIPNFALSVTFNTNNSSPNNAVQDHAEPSSGVTFSKINLVSVFYDRITRQLNTADCEGLTKLRDANLYVIASTGEPIVQKFATDQISELNKGAAALDCPRYNGPSV